VKIAVTGSGGGLGRAFLASVADEHDVNPFARSDLDVADFQTVQERVVPLEPDVVFHFAAMTSVDGCESDPGGAVATNVAGTFNVAAAARRTGALLVALSTDYVFDGEKGEPYDERDEPRPLASMYALTKLAGERSAQSVGPDLLIVRTAWVFGEGNDFVSKAVRRLAAGEDVGGIVDQVGSPTHVVDLAERLLPLVATDLRGVVHLAGPEATTWHDVLTRARELGDLPGTVLEQKAGELDRPAPRPANTSLTSVVLPGTAVPPMPPVEDSLRRVLADVGA
jgi:dTDP-4-dehydrorhamnose reductase